MFNVVGLSRGLGWISLGLGATETVAPNRLARWLGLRGEGWLVRAFGLRELAAGVMVLGKPDSPWGPALRIGGDVLDIAALTPALSRRNRQRGSARLAMAMVVGITALDLLCASTLLLQDRRRAAIAARGRVRRPVEAPPARRLSAATA